MHSYPVSHTQLSMLVAPGDEWVLVGQGSAFDPSRQTIFEGQTEHWSRLYRPPVAAYIPGEQTVLRPSGRHIEPAGHTTHSLASADRVSPIAQETHAVACTPADALSGHDSHATWAVRSLNHPLLQGRHTFDWLGANIPVPHMRQNGFSGTDRSRYVPSWHLHAMTPGPPPVDQ